MLLQKIESWKQITSVNLTQQAVFNDKGCLNKLMFKYSNVYQDSELFQIILRNGFSHMMDLLWQVWSEPCQASTYKK